jgi:large subunit ribosomal protein L15
MFELHNLESSGKKRKRVGRGGKRGGTSGKGHKGQKARSGGSVSARFEGGQMPLFRRLPKRGFNNKTFKKNVQIVNLKQLERFENETEVTKEILLQEGLVSLKKGNKNFYDGLFIKVLGNGTLDKKLTIHADAFSASAHKAIEETGGKAVIG